MLVHAFDHGPVLSRMGSEVWGRAHYLSVTEAPRNTEFYEWVGKKHFCFFQIAETGKRTPNSSMKGSGANRVKGSGANYFPSVPVCCETWK